MLSCPACGAAAPGDARWCGQCYAWLSTPPAPATAVMAAAAVAAPTPPTRVPVAPTPAPAARPAIPADAPARFGPAAALPPAYGEADRRPMVGGHALRLVVVAILVGAVGMGLSWWLGRDDQLEPATYIRYAIVITVGVYAIVAALVVTQLAPAARLRWTTGPPATGIVVGAAVGGGLGALLLAAVSAGAGHLSPDPRVVLMMSEGDAAHLVIAVLLTVVCAPLVEEVLFRGLLLESLRGRRSLVAVLVSAVAFAAWHLNPAALRYYALMGALLGVVYLKRGLVGSMAAHAAFNGVLTVAALAVVLAPAHTVTAGEVSLAAPGGWSVTHRSDSALELAGPSGATFVVVELPTATASTVDAVIDRLRSGQLDALPGLSVDTDSTREVRLPAGDAVEVDLVAGGHHGTMVLLPRAGHSIDVVFLSGGSLKAQADFPRLMQSLRVG